MKTNRSNPLLTASLLVLAAAVAHAGSLYFDGGTANIATTGDGVGAAVNGNWNTTLVNWDQGAGLAHVAWDNSAAPGTIAVFNGPVGNGNRTVTVTAVKAVDLQFSASGTVTNATRWTLTGGTITLGDTVDKKATINASAMLGGNTVGVNVISTLAGNVSGGLTLIGTDYHGTTTSAPAYSTYFNGLNPTRVNLLSLSNLGVNSFTGPVTIKNALEIQGLSGSRYKALGPATNGITLDNGTLLLYSNNGTLDQQLTVTGATNALNMNNNITAATVSSAVTSGSTAVLWSVAGTTNGRLTYTGDLSGFTGTLKVKGSATGATVIDTNTFGGTIDVQSASTLQLGNNTPRGTLGANAVVNNGTIVFNRSDSFTYSGAISGPGGVTKQGAGTTTLAGTNTYTGVTAVNAGRLNLTGSLTGDISLTGGAAISGAGSTTGMLTTATGTAIAAAGGASTAGLSVGSVTFSGPTSLDFASAPVAATTYDVLTYGDGGVVSPENFTSFVRGTLNHDTGAKKFTFTAAEPKSLVWDGATGDWDQVTTANWNSGADKFYDWDSVAFNDPAAPGAVTVTLIGTLRPSSIAVTNTTGNDYTFSGAGSLAGGTGLTKSGDGTLVLTTPNTHTGGTTLSGGTLRLQSNTAAGTGVISIGNATLSLFRSGDTTTYNNQFISSTGTTGLLTVDGSGTNTTTNNSTYTFLGIQVDGALTITRPSGSGITAYNGLLSGGGTLVVGDNNGGVDLIVDNTVNGRGRVIFNNTTNTFNGHVSVLERGNFLNNTVSPTYQTLTVNAGGAITLVEQGSGSQTTVGRFNGEGIVARNTSSGLATLVVGGANENDSFTGIIDDRLFSGGTGRIGLTKNGSATQTLSGAGIRHAGATTVNNGVLKLVDTTAWASPVVFGAAESPVLEFVGSESYTVAGAITGGSANAMLKKSSTGTLTLSGANTFTGSISVAAGTLAAGSNQAFGADGTTLTVADGAAVDTRGALTASRDYHAIIAGTGIDGSGVIVNSTLTNSNYGFRSLTLTADATIGGTGRWDVRPITAGQGLVDLAGKTLTKTGGNQISFVDGTITAGTVQVSQGRLSLTRCLWTSGTLNVTTGAILQFENNNSGLFAYGMGMTLADATLTTIGLSVETTGGLSLSGASTLDVAANLNHTQSGAASGDGTIAKTGTGTFTLGAADHTYNGAIAVNAGTLQVTGTKSGTGAITVASAATVGGTGTISGHTTIDAGGFVAPGATAIGTLTLASASLAGTYQCQVDAATSDRVNITGTLTVSPGAAVVITTIVAPTEAEYVIATYGTLAGTPPAVTGVPSGYEVDDSTPGVIKLVRADYDSWADSWTEPPLSDKAPGADPEKDGVSNLLEYILGGNPRVSDTSILPKMKIDSGFLVLSYKRSDASEFDTTQTGQWSTNLATWEDIAPVIVEENGDAPDDMEIRIPLTNAVNGMLYGRLKAEQPAAPAT